MLRFIKQNIFIALIFIVTLTVGFLTFLTFIDKSFIELTDVNLQYLLITNVVLLIIFFYIIFNDIRNSFKNDMNVRGSVANRKYIAFFSLFLLIYLILLISPSTGEYGYGPSARLSEARAGLGSENQNGVTFSEEITTFWGILEAVFVGVISKMRHLRNRI